MMESGFADFLIKENLTWKQESPSIFSDTKYGFTFPHDIKRNLDCEYEQVLAKYRRRIDKFRDLTRKPTVFFRMIWNDDEARYIRENRDYIDSVITRGNPENRLVLCHMEGTVTDAPEDSFLLHQRVSTPGIFYHMNLFDKTPELTDFCKALLGPAERETNKNFFLNSILNPRGATSIDLGLAQTNTLVRSRFLDAFTGKSWYIWGSGRVGNSAKSLLDEGGIRILGFIDNDPGRVGQETEGIRVYGWDEASKDAWNIFIAVARDESRKSIKEQIRLSAPQAQVMDCEDLLDLFSPEDILRFMAE